METSIQKKSDTQVTIQGSLPASVVEKEQSAAVKQLGKDIKLPGFREGKVPEKVLLQHVEQQALWQEMANRALNKALPEIVKEHELRVIGRPHINVTKLAPNNPLEFTAEFSILPDITLPDYKKIAQKHNAKKEDGSGDVTEKELRDAIENVLKHVPVGEKEEKPTQLTDELVKKLGPYKDANEFKGKLKEQIKVHKKHMALEKHRLGIIEEIISEAKFSVPDILIEAELDKMLAQMRADIQRAGMEIEQYMKQIGKTEGDFRKDWRSDAQKRAQIQLILNEIARSENITADEKEVEGQAKQLLAQHPPEKGDLKQAEIATRIYVATQLTNEKVFSFLESQEKTA